MAAASRNPAAPTRARGSATADGARAARRRRRPPNRSRRRRWELTLRPRQLARGRGARRHRRSRPPGGAQRWGAAGALESPLSLYARGQASVLRGRESEGAARWAKAIVSLTLPRLHVGYPTPLTTAGAFPRGLGPLRKRETSICRKSRPLEGTDGGRYQFDPLPLAAAKILKTLVLLSSTCEHNLLEPNP
jgi:hypothetical protein